MAYLGLVPSERSTGDSIRRGGITKTGNARVRRVLAESAWTYRYPAGVGKKKYFATRHLPEAVRDSAWKAQARLTKRYRALTARGKAQHGRRHRRGPRAGRLHVGDRPDGADGGLIGRERIAYITHIGGGAATTGELPVSALWPASPTARCKRGPAPDEIMDMRSRPAHQSLFTDVPGRAPTDMRTSLEKQASRDV